MNNRYDVVVVGGGPAGLMAAGKAAMDGGKVLLIEKMEKPARKLRITGKGRCNITNLKPLDEFLDEIHPDSHFLRDAFKEFFNTQTVQFFNDRGVKTVVERGQRVFPESGKAREVSDALIRWAKSHGVEIVCYASGYTIAIEEGKVKGINIGLTEGKRSLLHTVECSGVVLATGGKSYPATGSTGDGYALARECGHTIVTPRPSLVGVETDPVLTDAAGLFLKNVNLALVVNERLKAEEFGEMELTPFGLDGPIVVRHSRTIVDAVDKGNRVDLHLDLKPALSEKQLVARIQREIQANPRDALTGIVRKLLPQELVYTLIDSLGLAAQKPARRISSGEIEAMVGWLKKVPFRVTAYRGWDEAIITSGGVSLKEVNPRTMESRIVKGLYFAGELLDLDGSTGGYNLQIAFSTGWLAGKSVAAALQHE
ncbi:MAG TPA: NAD(P)/FAD-dependent oxidoreductase [Tenuifilaceae bacterium]|jgi:hypothetical protein|nr:NAD(P)/FAD-dependent oxidoreductase [Bacteroidales bacterium]MDI9516788.1 NAD(P)/FAD-dependent oxidoreductase [Bacteroidota bacterium]NLH56493.1 NAD(P)/FAD-dependent oxidoreductase [Rikenellaceae bacterium]OQC64554.1 MAG: tricarballylate dehydrogenase [Bacteroidetes bacterium ADurb.Bin008]HNV82490.1 NAD(P)/FAD-dependent oxidoreductase [Tenuifilaceae bacterium]